MDSAGPASGAGVAAPVIKRRKVRERLAWIVAAILGVAALLATAQSLRNRAQLPQMVKTSIPPPENDEFDFQAGSIALSPDGRLLHSSLAAPMASAHSGFGHSMTSPRIRSSEPTARPILLVAGQPLPRILCRWEDEENRCQWWAGADSLRLEFGRGGTWSSLGTIVFMSAGPSEVYTVPASAVKRFR